MDRPAPGRATITGAVVEVSSTGETRRTPVEVSLALTGDRWLISSFHQSVVRATGDGAATAPPALSADQRAAVQVVERYYQAIAARDFTRAYHLWGQAGPPGQSFAQFVRGYRETARVEVETGVPSRIEAAAGSRYADVPVVVEAITTTGAKQRFEGSYTLRRSVVDGATPEQRAWHIYRASLHQAAGG